MQIVQSSKLWDGQVAKLPVTDSKESAIELRALASARSPGDAFDLRCDIREQLIAFLQKEYPTALPHARVESLRADTPETRQRPQQVLSAGHAGIRPAGRRASGANCGPLTHPACHCSRGLGPPMLPPATWTRKRTSGRKR